MGNQVDEWLSQVYSTGRKGKMAEPLLSRATALLERWGCAYPARVNELAALLESVRAQGRQEGFAEARRAVCDGCRLAGDKLDERQRHREPMPIRCEALAIRALERTNEGK